MKAKQHLKSHASGKRIRKEYLLPSATVSAGTAAKVEEIKRCRRLWISNDLIRLDLKPLSFSSSRQKGANGPSGTDLGPEKSGFGLKFGISLTPYTMLAGWEMPT